MSERERLSSSHMYSGGRGVNNRGGDQERRRLHSSVSSGIAEQGESQGINGINLALRNRSLSPDDYGFHTFRATNTHTELDIEIGDQQLSDSNMPTRSTSPTPTNLPQNHRRKLADSLSHSLNSLTEAGKVGTNCSGKVWIFFVLGILLFIFGVVIIGIYLSIRELTSSLDNTEILPTYVCAIVVLLTAVVITLMFWTRRWIVVVVSIILNVITALLCLETVVLTGTHIIQPLDHAACVYEAPIRRCICQSSYFRNVLELRYKEDDLMDYNFDHVKSCEDITGTMRHMLYTVCAAYTAAFIVSLFTACLSGFMLRMKKRKKAKEEFQRVDYDEDIYIVSGGSSVASEIDTAEVASSSLPPPQQTAQQQMPALLHPQRAIENEYSQFAGLRRSRSATDYRRSLSVESEAGAHSDDGTSTASGIARNVSGVLTSERKGRLKEHRRRQRRAVTLHNLDSQQLMLILNLQMRYLQEMKEQEKSVGTGEKNDSGHSESTPQKRGPNHNNGNANENVNTTAATIRNRRYPSVDDILNMKFPRHSRNRASLESIINNRQYHNNNSHIVEGKSKFTGTDPTNQNRHHSYSPHNITNNSYGNTTQSKDLHAQRLPFTHVGSCDRTSTSSAWTDETASVSSLNTQGHRINSSSHYLHKNPSSPFAHKPTSNHTRLSQSNTPSLYIRPTYPSPDNSNCVTPGEGRKDPASAFQTPQRRRSWVEQGSKLEKENLRANTPIIPHGVSKRYASSTPKIVISHHNDQQDARLNQNIHSNRDIRNISRVNPNPYSNQPGNHDRHSSNRKLQMGHSGSCSNMNNHDNTYVLDRWQSSDHQNPQRPIQRPKYPTDPGNSFRGRRGNYGNRAPHSSRNSVSSTQSTHSSSNQSRDSVSVDLYPIQDRSGIALRHNGEFPPLPPLPPYPPPPSYEEITGPTYYSSLPSKEWSLQVSSTGSSSPFRPPSGSTPSHRGNTPHFGHPYSGEIASNHNNNNSVSNMHMISPSHKEKDSGKIANQELYNSRILSNMNSNNNNNNINMPRFSDNFQNQRNPISETQNFGFVPISPIVSMENTNSRIAVHTTRQNLNSRSGNCTPRADNIATPLRAINPVLRGGNHTPPERDYNNSCNTPQSILFRSDKEARDGSDFMETVI